MKEIKALSGCTAAKSQQSELLLCLTLRVFDLQRGDPAAGSSKNTSSGRVHLSDLLCAVHLAAH